MTISEIGLVLVVALLVIKPEDLPATIYTVGNWLKSLRQTITKIKQEIEIPFEKILHNKYDEKQHD